MATLSPLFVVGGAGIALLHTTVSDPLLELAEVEPGEVVVFGKVTSPAVPTKIGYRADVRVEHLSYEEKEVLRGGVCKFTRPICGLEWGTGYRRVGSLRGPRREKTASITVDTTDAGHLGYCLR